MKNKEKIKFDFKKLIGKIGKVFYAVIFAFLIIVASLVGISVLNIPGNYKLFFVQSGSMAPAIKQGAVVVVKPADKYVKGDVITFKEPKNPKITVTHRIFQIKEKDKKVFYITKGDANKSPDGEDRPKENVLGKMIFSVPYLGYPVSYAKTREGLIVLVVIPATLIIYSELMTIKNEVQKLLKERKKRKLTVKEKVELEIGEEEIKVEKGFKKFWHKIFKKKND